MVTRGRWEEAEGNLERRERHSEERGRRRESGRGRWEEVSRGTRDRWVETKGSRENERCRYKR